MEKTPKVHKTPNARIADAEWDKLYEVISKDSTLYNFDTELSYIAWKIGVSVIERLRRMGVLTVPREDEKEKTP